MFRTAIHAQLRPAVSAGRRTFVSTVLLTRNWESETVATLRKEAKSRGLSQTGNKSTLVARLLQHDQNGHRMQDPLPTAQSQQVQSPVKQQVRLASTTEVPGVPSSSEPPSIPATYPKEFLDLKIPEIPDPVAEPPTPIPFVPDFWDSSRVKAESSKQATEPLNPTVLAVAGDATHISASPVHSVLTGEQGPEIEKSKDTSRTTFFEDLAEDLYLPTSFKLPGAVESENIRKADLPTTTNTSAGQEVDHTRTLDKEERKGVWAFFGVIFGSFVVASVLEASPSVVDKVEEKAAEKH
ncbi:hypothetical protein K474DRAFT_1769806 [Panus rudis PR-1116 ss-1]|nr:hypothetical protein K474DRAFT_1769806 [Panus rudis PR-1116 ss-1]